MPRIATADRVDRAALLEFVRPRHRAVLLTVDQRASRRSPDRVPEALRRLNESVATVLPFERTAGDEFQGLLAEAADAVQVALQLVRVGGWSIGIGAGPVQTPLPATTR